MEIKFAGAAGTVTGSKHIITLWDNERILLDCGMYQGLGKDTFTFNNEDFADSNEISAILLVHGERNVQEYFKEKLKRAGHHSVVLPNKGEVFKT
jgi:Cft2 family RNA processing exonuclease